MWIRILPEGRLRKSIIYSPSSKLKLFPSIASWFYNCTQIIFGSNCLLLCPQPDETREAIWCFYASLLPVHTLVFTLHVDSGHYKAHEKLRNVPGDQINGPSSPVLTLQQSSKRCCSGIPQVQSLSTAYSLLQHPDFLNWGYWTVLISPAL